MIIEYDVESIRSRYQALDDVCYLNTGTVGIMSESVLERHLQRIAHYERYGHFGEVCAREGYERSRIAISDLINAHPGEVALTRNASDGVNLVLAGLELPDGAVLLTTAEEHPAVLLPLKLAAERCNGSLKLLSISGSDFEILAQLSELVESGNVAIAVLSHVSCETGKRLPIREMVRICRNHEVLTLVDGAQSVGQIPVDVRDIDCDFMTGNGHKWLCGPKGTGFLYVRSDLIPAVTPAYVGDGAIEPRFDRRQFDTDDAQRSWQFREDAQRFEFGTRNWHLFGGLANSIDELQDIGWSRIFQHSADLSTGLKRRLETRESVSVHTPAEWSDSSGLVTFSVEGWQGEDLSARLWNDFRIVQRRVQVPSAVRVSCAHFTSDDDLDRLVEALDSVAQS